MKRRWEEEQKEKMRNADEKDTKNKETVKGKSRATRK